MMITQDNSVNASQSRRSLRPSVHVLTRASSLDHKLSFQTGTQSACSVPDHCHTRWQLPEIILTPPDEMFVMQ